MTIRLLVFDIDGVLTDGEGQPLDLQLIRQLREINHAALKDDTIPAVTLCTGRPAPYVELMLQAVDGRLPAVYENGAGLYLPMAYRFLPHPELGNAKASMQRIRLRLEETIIQSGFAYLQPGKDFTLTLFATEPKEAANLEKQTRDALGPLVKAIHLVYSASCLNILPRHINKGKGIEFLASQSGVPEAEMLGIGDSDVDSHFLKQVGTSAAPANANENIKSLVHYVSPHQSSAGVRDILGHFGIVVKE